MDAKIGGMLIFAFSFLGVFIVVVGFIPQQFLYTSSTKYRSIEFYDVPKKFWNGLDLAKTNFTDTWNCTLENEANGFSNFDVGGHNLRLEFDHSFLTTDTLLLTHRYGFGLSWTEDLDWYDENGVLVSFHNILGRSKVSNFELDDNYDLNAEGFSTFLCKCKGEGKSLFGNSEAFSVTVYFSFNTTLYRLPSEAWNNADLNMLVGIKQEDSVQNITAWNLIMKLLVFQPLEIFDKNDAMGQQLSLLISAIFWVIVAFVTLVIMLELIPF